MKADAVIFDKDGTLLDFDAFWVGVSENAIEDTLKWAKDDVTDALDVLEAFGVHNGVTDIEGALCKGTYDELADIMYAVMKKNGYTGEREGIARVLKASFKGNTDSGEIKPTAENLADVLAELKRRNKKLAVVTTDNAEITLKCLKGLGIDRYFDKIYTDDGIIPTKPDPFCVNDFCTFAGIEKDGVVMVGDTMTDMNFAKNAGIRVIGIAKSEGNRALLASCADAVINDPSQLFEILE